MLFTLGANTVDVDVDATRAMYEKRIEIYRNCSCPSCRNYQSRLARISPAAKSFFTSMGVIPDKAEEAWAYLPGTEQGTQQYTCRFPLVYGNADIRDGEGFTKVEDGLMAGFRLVDGKAVLVVDWTLRWLCF